MSETRRRSAPGSSADLKKNFSSLGRVIRKLFSYYPRLAPLTVFCILFSAVVSAIPSVFVQRVLAVVENLYLTRDWAAARPEIVRYLVILAALYLLSLIAVTVYTQIMAYMTQGFLDKLRREMFDGMQGLPLRYFDTHAHGDIMSHYTNDIDTLRQLVSQALPNLIQSGAVVLAVFAVMLWFSLWLTLVLVLGIVAMFYTTKVVGGGSARYFMRQQQATGAMEGLAEELMSGQKVIKVFNHEAASIADFNAANNELYEVSRKANTYASLLGPIMANIGNLLYVVLALAGGLFLLSGLQNISISGLPFSISILVPFLNMAKQFTGNVNNLSQQFNAIVMAGAGAARVFSLIDEEPETDEGYVTLVNAREENGVLTETAERTGRWAWRHPHTADGSVTYTPLRGDVRMVDVDFAYEEGKPVLVPARPPSRTSSTASMTSQTARSATTASTSIRSKRPTCAVLSAWSCRRPISSPTPSSRTSATAASMPRMTSASVPPAWPVPMISSCACPMAIRPSCITTAPTFPRASAS